MKLKLLMLTFVALVVGTMVACGGGGEGGGEGGRNPAPVVIYDTLIIIKDGDSTVFGPIDAGKYRLELTATGNGVEVLWPGSDCSGQPIETQSHTEICTLKRSGQISISNPSFLGTGPSSSVTIKVTYLPN
jgi:hypothetical protein